MYELALEFGNGPVLMSRISERQNLSRKYLHALLTSLKRAGLVNSLRGARGNYELARSPEKIKASEVFEALEGQMAVVDCVSGSTNCIEAETCPTRGLWKRLNTSLIDVLEDVTLDDLVHGKV